MNHSYVILAVGALILSIGGSLLAAETADLKAANGPQNVNQAPGEITGIAGDIVAGNVTASGTIHASGAIKSGNTITINGAPFPGASDVITASTGQLAIGGAPSFPLIRVGIGTTSPSAETTLHVQAAQDNFGVLVDAAVPGSRIGLHAGSARFASLAKNAFFITGTGWRRFDTATGAYLQEVEPAGHVTFNVAPPAATPGITWNRAMMISNDGRVGIGTTNAMIIAPNGQVGIGGAPTVINYATGPFRPLFTVHGAIRVEDVPVWDGPNDHDLTWGAGKDDHTNVTFNPDRLLISREGSSRRYKEDIRPFDEDFAKILAVEPKVYRMREGYGPPGFENFGYIAEDLDEAGLESLVIYDREGRPDGVRYKKVALYVNEVVKAHHKMIEELQAEIAVLRKVVCSRHPTEVVCDGGRTARAR
ncbi:MAG: tail fiber domain-containing protein [Deltaproteobacteria bacterium]|nr:tail fiber domain-containing protein [Deltaproteobacteria bacterium]